MVRATGEVADWVATQVELAELDASRTLLMEAEVRALRAQISPHFIYNSLTAIASFTRTDPERARELLLDLRSTADVVIDSSGLNVHQLSAKLSSLFAGDRRVQLRIAVMSFGFKYGLPLDADVVFDMRFLPNPYWVPELRALTGRDTPVSEFVMRQEGADEFLGRAGSLLDTMIDGYVREGRRYVTVAVGCTGGKHRSVAIAEALSGRLGGRDRVDTFVVHRDLGRE